MPDELKPTKRDIPIEVHRKFDQDERDRFYELAGYFEFDEGSEGQAADQKAIFAIYDQRWKQKAEDARQGRLITNDVKRK